MFNKVNLWCEDNFFIVNNPMNTFSNIFYAIVSYLIYNDDKFLSMFTMITAIFSSLYHTFDTVLFQVYDFSGIYLIVFYIIYKYYDRKLNLLFIIIQIIFNIISIISLTSNTYKFFTTVNSYSPYLFYTYT